MKPRLPDTPILDLAARTKLRMTRAAKGLTLEQLAGLCGINKQSIANVENGNQRISAPLFDRLCHALGLLWRQEPVQLIADADPILRQRISGLAEIKAEGLRPASTHQETAAEDSKPSKQEASIAAYKARAHANAALAQTSTEHSELANITGMTLDHCTSQVDAQSPMPPSSSVQEDNIAPQSQQADQSEDRQVM